MKLRAGIIGSSGGSALRAAVDCWRTAGHEVHLAVVTDRECGLATWGSGEGFAVQRIPYGSAGAFSGQAADVMGAARCTDVLLFYTRRVASPLIDTCRVSNIHPSLLPAFPGLHGVEDTVAAGAPLLGATLHRVDAGLDTGPIVAQVACPLSDCISLARAQRLSYLQKVYLTLVWFDQTARTTASTIPPDAATNCGAGVVVTSAGLSDSALLNAYRAWVAHVEAHAPAVASAAQ